MHIPAQPSGVPTPTGQKEEMASIAGWAVSDVQTIHKSVFNRNYVLSLRTPKLASPQTSVPPTPISSLSQLSASTARSRNKRPSASTGISGVFGFRPRGRTFSGHQVQQRALSDDSIGPRLEKPRPTYASPTDIRDHDASSSEPVAKSDRVMFLCFETEAERKEWYTLFRSYSHRRTPDEPTCHRRLSISVFDLVETAPTPSHHRAEHDGDRTTEVWSRLSRGETHATTGYANDSVISKRARYLKEGWIEKDKLCLEVYADLVHY